jgi:hypothetical protein
MIALAVAPALLTPLQPLNGLLVNACAVAARCLSVGFAARSRR